MNKNQWQYLLILFLLPLFTWPVKVVAHGSKIKYRKTQAIEIYAAYDNEQPIANGQVIIYAPEDPSNPWLTGVTDEKGYFTFIPDAAQTGNWDVKVRKAGHGAIATIPITDSQPNQVSRQEIYTPWQKALLGVSGTWGFVGTALFFSKRKSE